MPTLARKLFRDLYGKAEGTIGDMPYERAMRVPNGFMVTWRGDEGVIVALWRRLIELEEEVRQLKTKKNQK